MVAKTWAALGAVTASLALASVAHADVESFNPDAFDLSTAIDRDVAPVDHALELAVGGHYTEGGGDTGGAQSARIGDLSGAGGGVQLELSARVSPHWAVGAYGSGAYFSAGTMDSGQHVYGASAGLQVVAHARPEHSVDPWASVGAGWRGMWLTGDQSTSLQGLELARVQLGIDYRISKNFAIAPVIGASAAMFLGENSPMTDSLVGIGDRTVHFYGWTGVQGRFDVGN
ncbi:MAG TPA: hypothetical protein VGM88_06030 [Kofleriaceae bacterium]|jgi:hypothetical protein